MGLNGWTPSGVGAILTSTIAAIGSGYATGDTGTIEAGNFDATYVIDTVDGGGGVVTFHLDNPGTGYIVDTGVPTLAGGSQPGGGSSFIINVTSVS